MAYVVMSRKARLTSMASSRLIDIHQWHQSVASVAGIATSAHDHSPPYASSARNHGEWSSTRSRGLHGRGEFGSRTHMHGEARLRHSQARRGPAHALTCTARPGSSTQRLGEAQRHSEQSSMPSRGTREHSYLQLEARVHHNTVGNAVASPHSSLSIVTYKFFTNH